MQVRPCPVQMVRICTTRLDILLSLWRTVRRNRCHALAVVTSVQHLVGDLATVDVAYDDLSTLTLDDAVDGAGVRRPAVPAPAARLDLQRLAKEPRRLRALETDGPTSRIGGAVHDDAGTSGRLQPLPRMSHDRE